MNTIINFLIVLITCDDTDDDPNRGTRPIGG